MRGGFVGKIYNAYTSSKSFTTPNATRSITRLSIPIMKAGYIVQVPNVSLIWSRALDTPLLRSLSVSKRDSCMAKLSQYFAKRIVKSEQLFLYCILT